MADKLKLELVLDDKGTVTVKKFGTQGKKAFKDLGKSSDRLNKKFGSLGKALLGIGAAVGGLYAVKRALDMTVRGAAIAVKHASDLQEVTSKFEVVYKGQIALAESWGKVLVDSYLMSTRESKQYLSSVQDLLVPMGMAADEAGKMSFEVVKLSADLGSFNNLPTAQVMDDIQSALVGNYETMKKYGVVLNATVVQEKALEMGLAATKAELTAGEKAQAAYALMVKGSQAAIGDIDRTSEGYANQLKQVKANIEDLTAAIGESFLPVLTDLIKGLNSWYKANEKLLVQELPQRLREAATELKGILSGELPVFAIGEKAMAERERKVAEYLARTQRESIKSTTGQKAPIIMPEVEVSASKMSWFGMEGPTMDDEPLQNMLDAYLKMYGKRQAAQEEFNLTYEEMTKSSFDREREQIEQQRALWQEAGVDKARLAKWASKKTREIDKAEYMERLSNIAKFTGGMADQFLKITQMGGKHSKTAFKMYQGFKIAEIAAGIPAAAFKAYESVAWIPFIGQALGIAAAGMVGAFGAAQIASIHASQPPSMDEGGITRARGIYQTGDIDEIHLPLKGGKLPGGGRPVVIIQLNNPTFQDLNTQRQALAQIAEIVVRKIAPQTVYENYNNAGFIRDMVMAGA